jgi:hypothetical protein
MKASRLEEVLDECLSAYLDGRRTVEESLSLYPDLRDDLEPLLRTAVALAGALSEPQPSSYRRERGLEEFLNSASVRRRARELTKDLNISRRLAAVGGPRLGLIAGAVAIIFMTVAAAVTAFDGSPEQPMSQAGFVSPPASAAVIGDLRQTQARLREMAFEGRSVSPGAIRALTAKTVELEAQLQELGALDERSRRELEQAIAEQFVLLQLLVTLRPADDIAPVASQALDVTEEVAEDLGVDLPNAPAVTPPGSPSSAPTQTPARSATPSPQPSVSPTPTPSADETSTPGPVPSAPAVP